MNPSPFVKWAGGKSQLLPQYKAYFPTIFRRYIEAFVGGGAVLFHLYSQGRLAGKPMAGTEPGRIVLIDRLEELINCYRVIQSRVEALIAELQRHEPRKQDEAYFYQVRDWDRAPDYTRRSDVECAARFIFLNRTCYNGLYRVNRRGQFNVPFGRYRNPTICDADNLRAVGRAMQGVTLLVGDFSRCLEVAERDDFVYLDPPYHPLSETANFTSYTSADFGVEDQRRLAECFRELDQRGCQVMLSNSYTDLIQQLYAGYKQCQVQAIRAISSRGDRRGAISELLVTNQVERRQKPRRWSAKPSGPG